MRKIVFMLVIVLVLAGVTVGTGYAVHYLADYQPNNNAQVQQGTTVGPDGKTYKKVNLTLQVFPQGPDSLPDWEAEHNYHLMRDTNVPVIDPHLDWVTYGPGNDLVIPAHSLVTITIQNYDGGISLLNDFYTNVRGTVNNQMTVNGVTTSHLSPDLVSHTFTIHGIPSANQPWLFVSVPLLQVPVGPLDAGTDKGLAPQPTTTTFSFYVQGPGHYVWQCEYPCGNAFDGFGGPMATHGYMNGTFTVQ